MKKLDDNIVRNEFMGYTNMRGTVILELGYFDKVTDSISEKMWKALITSKRLSRGVIEECFDYLKSQPFYKHLESRLGPGWKRRLEQDLYNLNYILVIWGFCKAVAKIIGTSLGKGVRIKVLEKKLDESDISIIRTNGVLLDSACRLLDLWVLDMAYSWKLYNMRKRNVVLKKKCNRRWKEIMVEMRDEATLLSPRILALDTKLLNNGILSEKINIPKVEMYL